MNLALHLRPRPEKHYHNGLSYADRTIGSGESVILAQSQKQMVAELSILSRIFDFLSRMPSAKEIVALKATQEEEDRFTYLSDRSNSGNATKEEEDELEKILLAQHLMVIAKANALGVLKRAQN